MSQINPNIFKAYDIRGIYPDDLNEEASYLISRAFAELLKRENPGRKLKLAVGWDMRQSSPVLKRRVISGLQDSGVDVDEVGLVSTPTFYFAVAFYGYDGGIQVSASHNPKEYNGMKLVRARAVPVSKNTGIRAIYEMIANKALPAVAPKKGKAGRRENILKDELEQQTNFCDFAAIKPFKIVIDAANAMGALDMEALFSKLPCQVIKMNFRLDGSFPAHQPDPMVMENTEALRKRVVEEEADLGIAPDGDGDRYFFVDEQGKLVPQAILRGLMAQIELEEHPRATVAYDIRPGRITKDMIDQYNGKAIVTPVGHSLIKEMMIENDAIFGGESSGHYFYKFPYGTFEAPMVLVLKFLRFMSQAAKPVSEMLKPYDRYFHSGEINTKMEDRRQVEAKIEAVKEKYKDGKQIFIDGVTVEYPDVWFNLRASNTEPLIRLTVEGKTREIVERTRDDILALIRGRN